MIILDGRVLSTEIKATISKQVKTLNSKKVPKLAVIIIGNDYPSQVYVESKIAACHECGIVGEVIKFPENVPENDVIAKIKALNQDSSVHGILVQLPIAAHLNQLKILNMIAPDKDVDGLTATNAGKLLQGDPSAIIPRTVKGILQLLRYYQIKIKGQNITIINNSNIIGKPLSLLLTNFGATVSIVHQATKDLQYYLKNADLICTATGVKNLFTANDVKKGVVIVDIAINKSAASKRVIGDVNWKAMQEQAYAVTPVPGGVGPMTIAMLLDNLMILYNLSQK